MTDTINRIYASEQREIANEFNFENYRIICDRNTVGSRKSGILGEAEANIAVSDPLTINITVEGEPVPLLVPVKYAPGYDAQRCGDIVENYSGAIDVEPMFLSVPPRAILSSIVALSDNVPDSLNNDMFVFAEVNSQDEELMPDVIQTLAGITGRFEGARVSEIIVTEDNPRGRIKDGNLHPDMRLYATDITRVKPISPDQFMSFSEAVDAYIANQPKDIKEGSRAFKGGHLAEDRVLLDQLWEIYRERFIWLAGGTMPIALEDTREEFDYHMTLDTTTTMAVFVDSSPRAFMYFSEDAPTTCSWLNKEYFTNLYHQNVGDNLNLFFPGVVAKPENGGYMGIAVHGVIDMVELTGKDLQVTFESTNISAMYIPRMVRSIINSQGSFNADHPQPVDYHRYRVYQIAQASDQAHQEA